MKSLFSRTLNNWRKRVVATAIVSLAIFLPVAVTAASYVKFQANTTVANATQNAGTMKWSGSTSAKYNEVVAIQVVYDNNEAPGSHKTVNNLHVKINIPQKAGKSQTITTTTSGDNIRTVKDSAKVALNRADAYLQYIPGTATWKHAKTAHGPMTVTQKVSDNVVLSANGINLGKENPCQAGSIVVQARVMVPGVSIDKSVRLKGTHNWTRSISAKPGDTVQYLISYKNDGNSTEKNVVIGDKLPKGVTYVPGTTYLANDSAPNGKKVPDGVTTKGVIVGTYLPGANAFVMFDAKLPTADQLACGDNMLRNIASAQPQGMNYYWNTADVTINKKCETQPNQPQYSCNAFELTVDKTDRSVKVSKYDYTAKNGADFKNVVIDWGDNSTPLTTNHAVGQTHQYAKDGTYTVTATTHFTVNDKDVAVDGCSQVVSFNTPSTPTKPGTPPSELPNTGAGDVIGLFAVITAAGAIAHRWLSRRLAL